MGSCLSCLQIKPIPKQMENHFLQCSVQSPMEISTELSRQKSISRYFYFFGNLCVNLGARTMDFQISFADLCKEKPGKINSDYVLLHPHIGKGSFGEVRKATHKISGLKRAIKIIPKQDCTLRHQKRILNEIEILKKLVFFILYASFLLFVGSSQYHKSL